jgi:hypothetical protein
MSRKFLIAAGAAALLTGALTGPATAKSCLYVAFNPFTQQLSDDIAGRSVGITQKGACRRAKRYCLNKLRRAWKKGKAQQFACKRVD